MIDRLSIAGSLVHVHLSKISLKTTKVFTHGSLVFDLKARTATFGKLPPVRMPNGLALAAGAALEFHLVAPDGALRKQTRSGVLKESKNEPDILRIAGMSKTPRRFSAADGWHYEIYKYRAYFSHPGLKTDNEIPAWLNSSIERQKALWNRLAYLCREARRKCSPLPTEEIVALVQGTILPQIDAFNNALGRSKDKMKHPAKLKTENPGIDSLWRFVGELRKRLEKGRPVPCGLLEEVVKAVQHYKLNYSSLDEFLANLPEIAEKEASALALRRFEIRPTVKAFRSILERRRTTKAPWSEGWPLIKYPDSPKAANWGLHFYFNMAGCDSALLESGEGVPGLSFGPKRTPASTGHHGLTGRKSQRVLREAEISIPAENRGQWILRFGVLQHRPLPPNSHLKEWKLVYRDSALWLCLVVELQRPVPIHGQRAAGLNIGWRRTERGLRFGTLYEPATKSFRELTIDLQKSPDDPKNRELFCIDMGPTRWEKRNITRLLPNWKAGEPIPGSFDIRTALQSRRDRHKDTAKFLLRRHFGERLPAWFDKAGRRGLRKLTEEFKDDVAIQHILNTWQQEDEQISQLASIYLDRATKRLEYGHAQVAHDVCRHLQEEGVVRLIAESSFLAKASQRHDNEDPISLKRSQKYRQFAAVGKFMTVLKNTAVKYGIVVDELAAINKTRICQHCNELNPSTEKLQFACAKCGQLVKQDQNAAVNLSRFGRDPELAEMALRARTPEAP